MEDSKIIELFFERSERAIAELSEKYGKLCMKVSMNILDNLQDAEECVNDSYMGAWNAIPPTRPNPLVSFICRLVRNLSINRYKYNNAEKRKTNFDLCLDELDSCFVSSRFVDDEIDERILTEYINEYLRSLDRVNRVIFVRRFWYMDSYEEISKICGLKGGAVRVRVTRTKAGLKQYLEERGVIV